MGSPAKKFQMLSASYVARSSRKSALTVTFLPAYASMVA